MRSPEERDLVFELSARPICSIKQGKSNGKNRASAIFGALLVRQLIPLRTYWQAPTDGGSFMILNLHLED
eukprot:scaffold348_cov31-Tisochrysis_lutea.AAC.2